MTNDRAVAYINIENLRHNYNVIKSKVKESTKVMAVVKANAYGHDVKIIADELDKCGADMFAVSNISEALELRSVIPHKDILILGFTHPSLVKMLYDNNLTQTVYGIEFAEEMSKACVLANVEIKVHLAFDTGMNRIGFKDSQNAVKSANLKGFEVEGAFTHFACADENTEKAREFTKNQYDTFLRLVNETRAAGVELPLLHCANSAAIFKYPEYQLDMVRTGVITYGLKPNNSDDVNYKGVKPVMSISSMISHVKNIKKGDCVGYGAEFVADRNLRVGTIPVGYADGYRRKYNTGYVLVNGKKAKILGRVCMDQFMIDITNIDDVGVLTPVTLLGKNGDEEITCEMLANSINTISYEVVTGFTKRLTRQKV